MVSADASSYGIGGVLLQKRDGDWRPVAYASRSLTKTEQGYAQIEKECLAAVWTCEMLDQYLFSAPRVHRADGPQAASAADQHQRPGQGSHLMPTNVAPLPPVRSPCHTSSQQGSGDGRHAFTSASIGVS